MGPKPLEGVGASHAGNTTFPDCSCSFCGPANERALRKRAFKARLRQEALARPVIDPWRR